MKKQFIKSVLALLILLSVLMAGCGAEETETTAAVETTEAETVVTLGPQDIDDPTEATPSETSATPLPESESAETTAPVVPETEATQPTSAPTEATEPAETTAPETSEATQPTSAPTEATEPAETTAPETTEAATEPSEEDKGPVKPTLGAIEID